jgi:predicted AAA+ superfamily ATPase
MIDRFLVKFPHDIAFFMFGPRQVGKSTVIAHFLKKKPHLKFDLLNRNIFSELNRDPMMLKKQIEYQIKKKTKIDYVYIDEIQKIPELLDVVHSLIEEYKIKFILSGSSARKIKRSHANLLGGRAAIRRLYPFLLRELMEQFSLSRVLSLGAIPGVYFDTAENAKSKLQAYVETYLKEEIAQEGIVRNLGSFQRFLEVAAVYSGEILNFENVAREGALSSKTVAGYFEILEDTLIGFRLKAWDQTVKKQLAKHPKFYFFDNGVVNTLAETITSLPQELRGKRFEQWIINEVRASLDYSQAEMSLFYWRTQAGNEVDLLITRSNVPLAAIEIKAKKKVSSTDLSGLKSLHEEYPKIKHLFCVCEVEAPYLDGVVEVVPYKEFLTKIIPIMFKQ